MAEKKHVIEYIDIIKAFEKVKEKLKNKSNKGHQHGNADITDIDASKIKSGTIDIDRLPKGAIERMVYVKDDAARFALTTNTVQNGDTVKVTTTKKMFYVIDDTKLSSEAGYEPYTAESASAVPWSGVTGKPTTFTPEAHTHAISEVADLQETLTGLRQDVNAKPSTNTTYSLIQDSTDGHKLTFKGSDGSTKTVTIPDNDHNDNTTYSLKKTGSKIQLVGSDGSTTEVTDDNTTYDLDAMINALPVGTDDPVDNDYYVSQNVDGGTSDTGYFRRPVSKLWNYIKTKLATVATSGSYTDLSNKPTIGNGKVTVNQNGTTKGTFTMNQTGDTVINLTDSDTNTNTWRDVVDSLDSTRTDASLSANQGRILNDKFGGYLPLSGGDMTGDITFNGYGASTIGNGDKDGAGLDAKNNLNIASWYGVSFTTKCAGFAYSDKPGVSIDCRNGTLAVAGAIYANGGVVGDLTGNAKTATTANSANSANELKSITLTGPGYNTAGFRLIASINVGANWSNYRANFIVRSRHQGNGLLCIAAGCNSNVHNKENTYAQIRYYGNTISGDIIKSSRYQAYLSPDCKTVYLLWLYEDYSEARLTPVYGSDFEVSNGTWMTTSIDESTYGTCIAQTEINCANGGYCDNSIVSENANHLYNTQSDGLKNSMTFNWRGKDGQPTWLWGGEDGSNMYVYNPSNFSVNYANRAGSANSVAWGNVSGRPTALSSFTNDSGFITGISKSMVTDALGYTPPTTDTNTWRGIQDNLTSTSTSDSLSANQGRVLKNLIDGKQGAGNYALKSEIPTTLPASDVYAWAKASSKPSYSWSEISGKPSSLPANGGTANSAKYINYSINKYVTGNSMKTPYWRFATIEVSSDWYDQSVILLVNTGCVGDGFGIIKLSVRSNQISNTENAYCEFSWLVRRGFDPNQFIVKGYSASKTTNYFDIYFKATGTYQGITVTVLSSGSRGNISFDWKLTNDEPRAAMDLRTYNYELVSSDEGVVDYATSAGSANSVAWGNVSGRPTALSSFTNDRGFITGSDSRLTNARPASDVYSWAKASSKPSYTWTEISNKPDMPSISKDTPTRTNWTINSDYNCVVYRIGDFCLAVVAVTGTIYPRQWLPAAKLSKDFTPHTQSSIVICSVSGSDHMECMVTKDGYIKMWWSGSSPASSANICIPYYLD